MRIYSILFTAGFAATLIGCDTGPKIIAISECPDNAFVVGEAPPEGYQQRCMKPGDIRHGISRSWYPNGQVRAETSWRDGVKDGSFTLWYENGQKRSEGQDVKGFPVGTWTYWDEEGNILQQRSFDENPSEIPLEIDAE